MKKILTLVTAAFIFTSCGNNSESTDNQVSSTDESMNHMHSEESIVHDGPIDPICKMVKNDDWELYSVHSNDTTWFCSDFCKETFDKNPEKYAGS